MRVTAPAPVTFLPENLFSLFSRPGRELTVRIVQIEGKTLTLETGGEKFQARIAGTLLPEDFRPGETLRVRVLSSGPPVLLHLVEGERLSQAEARLLKFFQEIQARLPRLSPSWPLVSEKPDLKALVSLLLQEAVTPEVLSEAVTPEELKREIKEPIYFSLRNRGDQKPQLASQFPEELSLKEEAFKNQGAKGNVSVGESLKTSKKAAQAEVHLQTEPVPEEKAGVSRKEAPEERPVFQEALKKGPERSEKDLPVLGRGFQPRGLWLPFVFSDRTSWGFLEIERENQEAEGARHFYLRLFLSELGVVEAFLRQWKTRLQVHFYFSREEALEWARRYLSELKSDMAERGLAAEIMLEKSYYEPGTILAKEG